MENKMRCFYIFVLPTLAWAACSPNAKFDDQTAAPCDGGPVIASGGIYIDETVSLFNLFFVST